MLVVGIALGGNVEVAWTVGVGVDIIVRGGNVEVALTAGVVGLALDGNVDVA